MKLFIFPLVLAMGDPNFVPSNPADTKMDPELDSMIDTTRNMNQIDQKQTKQLQEERKYNQNEDPLDYRLDDAFKDATGTPQQRLRRNYE